MAYSLENFTSLHYICFLLAITPYTASSLQHHRAHTIESSFAQFIHKYSLHLQDDTYDNKTFIMSLEIHKVSKRYGQQEALKEVSFAVKQGEIVGFLGPNGAGKSTLMKIITGYIPMNSGKIEVCGMSTHTHAKEIKRKIGYLPEHNPLYLDMYVREYLHFVGNIYHIKKLKSKVDELIQLTGLEREQHKKIEALSKGYRQRVGIAQALLPDPEVLILDEPSTGLDPNQIIEVRNLIKAVAKNKTVMLSTHIMQEVDAICQRVVIIDKGEIVADCPQKELKHKLQSKKTIRVTFNTNIKHHLLETIPGVIDILNTGDQQYTINHHSNTDLRECMYDFAVQQGVKLLELIEQEESTESLFRQLTQSQEE